jgi:uncharacterized protein with GYD domain
MPMYIALVNWTDQGVKELRGSPARTQALKQLATGMGCTVHAVYYTMGRCDIVTRVEAPDDATVSALALRIAQAGNVRTETMRAYTEEEFAQIVEMATG